MLFVVWLCVGVIGDACCLLCADGCRLLWAGVGCCRVMLGVCCQVWGIVCVACCLMTADVCCCVLLLLVGVEHCVFVDACCVLVAGVWRVV